MGGFWWEARKGSQFFPSLPSDFPGGSDGKPSAYNAGDRGSIPGLGRSPGEGNGNPLQYSCLQNSMDGGTWWAAVHGVPKSWTWLTSLSLCLSVVCRHSDWGTTSVRGIIRIGRPGVPDSGLVQGSMVEGRCFCPMLWKKRVVSLYKVNSRVFSLGDHRPYFAGDSPSITSFVLV